MVVVTRQVVAATLEQEAMMDRSVMLLRALKTYPPMHLGDFGGMDTSGCGEGVELDLSKSHLRIICRGIRGPG